jgi:putative ABC transport system ATP-binding protein
MRNVLRDVFGGAHAAQAEAFDVDLLPVDMGDVVFETRGVTKVYDMGETQVHALRGIDLELYSGELVVLLGPSGSGKSTLLNIIGGLDTATDGTVRYRGWDLTNADEDQLTLYRRFHVGFIFQFYNLIPSLTAEENVAIVTEIARDPMEPRDALDLVGLADRADHFPAELSGGQQQRVAIARAVAKQPAVLLCDEPTGALDSETGVIVLEVLQNINAELGTTTAIITHNQVVSKMAQRVIHLSDGRVSEIEEIAEQVAATELAW